MKSSDRTVIIVIGIIGALAAIWMLVISPKRSEVSDLDDQITALEASVAEQEQLVTFAEQAKDGYEQDYHQLVVLGKAVPADDDTSSLLTQTQTLADRASIDFRSIAIAAGGPAGAVGTQEAPATPAPAPAPGTATPAAGSSPSGEAPATTETTVDPGTGAPGTSAPATEAAVATLPIGATTGPAGLPVMPYDISFRGDFFQIADFFAELDSMVRLDSKGIGVDGRLLTIDGFSLAGDQARGFPYLQGNLHVTTFVAPADQGVTAGATAAAPGATTTTTAPTAPATGEVVP
jgi:hypothetical protein